MFGTIRKHQTGLWLIIIALMSVSLLYFFLPGNRAPGDGMGDTGSYGSISGKPGTHKEFYENQREVYLSHFFRKGNWPGSEETAGRALESETLQRLLLIHKLKEQDITPSDKAVAGLVQEQLHDGRGNEIPLSI